MSGQTTQRNAAGVSTHTTYVTRTNAGGYSGFADVSDTYVPNFLPGGIASDTATLPDLNGILVIPIEPSEAPPDAIPFASPDRSIYTAAT